jgi:two-component system, sensor histidine kinase and response regulator
VDQLVGKRQLRKLGDVVASGLEVLESIDRVQYDLLLMDCQMPEMDGYEATRRIRQRSDILHGIPIVAFTDNAVQDDREKRKEAGMDDYGSKTVKLEDLAATIERSATQKPEKQGTFSAPASTPTPATTLLDAAG